MYVEGNGGAKILITHLQLNSHSRQNILLLTKYLVTNHKYLVTE